MSNHNDNEADPTSSRIKSIPPGWSFDPDDQQLLLDYLRPMHDHQPFHRDVIHVVDLYAHSPNELAASYKAQGKKEWYFFTKRVQKYKNGTRPNRRAANGFWKATSKDIPVMNAQEVIGHKRTLNYYQGKPSDKNAIKTSWIMYEYRLHEEKTAASNYRLTERARKTNCSITAVGLQSEPEVVNDGFWCGYVLCKVYRNDKAENGVKKEERHEDDLMPIIEDDNKEISFKLLLENINFLDDLQEFEPEPILQGSQSCETLLSLENNIVSDSQIDGTQLRILRSPPVSVYQGYPTFGAYSSFDELSAIFTHKRRRDDDSNALYNHLDNCGAIDLPSSSSYMSPVVCDELSVIFQSHCNGSTRN